MMSGTVLLADDDRAIRTVLSQALTRAGCRVRSTGAASTLWRWIEEGEGDLVVTDVMLPDGDALDLLPNIKRRRPELPVIVMSAQNTVMTAIRAAQNGAYEYLPKPFDLREVLNVAGRAMSAGDESGVESSEATEEEQGLEQLPLIGRSPAMQDVYRIMARLMHTDLTVMIAGASGTGKELVARALHNYGRRKSGPFIAVNMAAIPRELIESELFGHEKGAFTGATERARGKFELAQGGTLFLDEIGDMPPEAQTRLLRVLQEGEFVTVGGRQAIKTDVRIVAATHQDLRRLIREGLFREDLYYRLNVVPVRLPALKERVEDIVDLARAFLRRAADEGLPSKTISRDALELLKEQPWPGNVRELEQATRRILMGNTFNGETGTAATDDRRERLADNTRRLRTQLRQLGWDPLGQAHVVPIVAGSRAVPLADRLLQAGVFAPPIRYPTVARGHERLRFTVTAAHTPEQIDRICDALGPT